MDIREIDINKDFLEKTELTTKNHKYTIVKRTKMSIDRYQHLHGISQQIIKAANNDAVGEILARVEMYLKQNNIFDASVYVHEQKQNKQLYKVSTRLALEACATFIVRDDEEQALYNPNLTEAKIEDWTKEGLPFEGFFCLLITYSTPLAKIWSYFFQAVSEEMNRAEEKKNQSQSEKP